MTRVLLNSKLFKLLYTIEFSHFNQLSSSNANKFLNSNKQSVIAILRSCVNLYEYINKKKKLKKSNKHQLLSLPLYLWSTSIKTDVTIKTNKFISTLYRYYGSEIAALIMYY